MSAECIRAACYIRVSTDEQTDLSPSAQLRAITKYCEAKGFYLSNDLIYRDDGVSARHAETRPEFMRMIADAKRKPKPFDVILVHKFDRFARNREDSVVYKSVLRKQCGINVISVCEQLDGDRFSIILESILEAMAEYYSLNLSDEVKKGMSEKALRGELQTPAPIGYVMRGGTLLPEDEEAFVVKEIFRLYAYKGMSIAEIAGYLNGTGRLTKKGNPFRKRSVDYILKNPLYAGKIRWNPNKRPVRGGESEPAIISDGRHEAIIDEQTFAIAAERLSHEQGRIAGERKEHPLYGKLKCGRCGGNMYLCGKIFRCGGYLNKKCPFSQGVTSSKLERLVAEKALQLEKDGLHKEIDKIYYDKQSGSIDIIFSK